MRTAFNKNTASTPMGMTTSARGKRYSRRKNQSHAVQNASINPTPSSPEQTSAICTAKLPVTSTRATGSLCNPGSRGCSIRLTRRNVSWAAGAHSIWLTLIAATAAAAGRTANIGSPPVCRRVPIQTAAGAKVAKSASVAATATRCHATAMAAKGTDGV